MKIVGWNLLNIGNTKLGKAFTPTFLGFGLGNNILDYICNVVMGEPTWNNLGIAANTPADVFVIIELKTGGKLKGGAVSGTCIPTITNIRNALNQVATANGITATHKYAFATPLITGNHEAVGVIYNKRVFNANPVTETLRDNMNNNINPRTPFMVTLVKTANNEEVKIVGIHAPPVKGGADVRYKPPIDFIKKMGFIDELDPAVPIVGTDFFIMGDFNCNPDSYYISKQNNKRRKVFGFKALDDWGYETNIPNGTLTSLRKAVNNNFAPPANYMSEAYDNLFYKFANHPMGITEQVLDLIAHARNMNVVGTPAVYPASTVALLNNNNKVSDHFPFVIEF